MLDALQGLKDKLQQKVAQATLKGALPQLEKMADRPEILEIRRSPVQDGDSRPQDPETPITYVMVLHSSSRDKKLGEIRWNPDHLMEDLQALGEEIPEGPITDMELRKQIVQKAVQETRTALEESPHEFSLEKHDQGVSIRSEQQEGGRSR